MFSEDGVMYIPNGQCASHRRAAYSRDTAARVTGFEVVSGAFVGTAVAKDERDGILDDAVDFAPARGGPVKSIVGDGMSPPSILYQ